MKWASFAPNDDPSTLRVGVVVGSQIHAAPVGMTLTDCFGESPQSFADTGRALESDADLVIDLGQVRLHSPVPRPPSIRDFMVFEEHALNGTKAIGTTLGDEWYEMPGFYFTNPAAVRGDQDPIRVAPGSERYDYEAELGAVIGWSAQDASVAGAADLIAGYCLLIDWSARDLQAREMRMGLGPAKGKDTATSLGPVLITGDEIASRRTGRGYDLDVTVQVNGRSYTSSNYSAMYWSFEEAISYASRGTELVPGDIFGSGTCGQGCILELQYLHGDQEYPWLQPDDRVTVTADVLGRLEHVLRASNPPHALRREGRAGPWPR